MERRVSAFCRILALVLVVFVVAPGFLTGVAADAGLSENFAKGANAVANSRYSEKPAESAVDEDMTTWWRSLSSCEDDFIYLIVPFSEEVEINLIRLALYDAAKMSFVEVSYTTDEVPSADSEWIAIEEFVAESITPTIDVIFETVAATGVKFYAELKEKPAGLYELEAYYAEDTSLVGSAGEEEYKSFVQDARVDAEIVSVGENGELIYAEYDENGGKLIDYSYAGYHNGEDPIPNIEVVKTIEPGDLTDHTELIQDAINEVAAKRKEQRGAILLKAGTYIITSTINIKSSGIVLRGEGQGEDGTVIYDAREETNVTSLVISGSGSVKVLEASMQAIVDEYVPMGETTIKIKSAERYEVGETVRITCTPNALWVKTLGMDVIPGSGSVQWNHADFVMNYDRWVTAVDKVNNTITINTGIPLTLDKQYYSCKVQKTEEVYGRVTECGVENLRLRCRYDGTPTDENHAGTAIRMSNCRDCWVRDVTAKHYSFAMTTVRGGGVNVTVERCSNLEPISVVEGGKRYAFLVDGGQYVLFKNCYSQDSRHDYVLQARNCGPNVFLDSVSENGNAACEPHHRWSTGALYDNIYVLGTVRLSYIQLINRGNYGSGHGWASANSVMWNCLAPALIVGKPQTEQNFAVGIYGNYEMDKTAYLHGYKKFVTPSIVMPNYPETQVFDDSPMHGNGYIESPYNPVNPSSLYRAQLSYRLYGDATKNVIPCAPILQYPFVDSTAETRTVTFSGVRDRGADAVYVWIDGEKHEATLGNDETCSFTLDIALPNGYHDIYVTQRIGGIESEANATRTVFVQSDEPYVAPEDPNAGENGDETEKIDDPLTPPEGDNKGIIIAVVAVVCIAAGVGVFFVVKKNKRK